MGRKPSRWLNLPKGMRARPRGQKVFYYLDTGEKPRREIPLGSDYVMAVQKWAELTSRAQPEGTQLTVAYVIGRYWVDVIPGKAARTQDDNEREREWLLKFFEDAPLDSVEPKHIRQYLDWRVKMAHKDATARNDERVKAGKPATTIPPKHGQVRANREMALFSHVWNYAREQGFTALPNPCPGVRKFQEDGRDVYVEDEMMAAVMLKATPDLRLALRLAHITGQRPSDVLRMSETDLTGGVLNVRQGKTGAKLRIIIEGELASLVAEIRKFKAEHVLGDVKPLALLVSEEGKTLTYSMLRNRFDDARDAAGIGKKMFQFRDLRAKAATEADDTSGIRAAQALLGHTTENMTSSYVRHKMGKKVSPLR